MGNRSNDRRRQALLNDAYREYWWRRYGRMIGIGILVVVGWIWFGSGNEFIHKLHQPAKPDQTVYAPLHRYHINPANP
jgi:hypothetical protein